MGNVIFRVVIKVGYNEAWFEFSNVDEAAAFAKLGLAHMVDSEDQRRRSAIVMQVVDKDLEDKEDE